MRYNLEIKKSEISQKICASDLGSVIILNYAINAAKIITNPHELVEFRIT